MKLSSIVGLAALAGTIEALPTVESGSASIEARRLPVQCTNPGEHKCAMLVWYRATAKNPRSITVVGGQCNDIKKDGEIQNTGDYSAHITTNYGTHLYMGASNIGPKEAGGFKRIRYQYGGKEYFQKDCSETTDTLWQCPFDC